MSGEEEEPQEEKKMAVEPTSRARRRLGLKRELLLALLPTATILVVLALVEVLAQQRLLFASLASSAFSIYLNPDARFNSVRTLVFAQVGAAVLGLTTYLLFGAGYLAAGSAMVLAIVLMVTLDAMHPPAVATALSFGLRASDASNMLLFTLAVAITAVLLLLQRFAVYLAKRW